MNWLAFAAASMALFAFGFGGTEDPWRHLESPGSVMRMLQYLVNRGLHRAESSRWVRHLLSAIRRFRRRQLPSSGGPPPGAPAHGPLAINTTPVQFADVFSVMRFDSRSPSLCSATAYQIVALRPHSRIRGFQSLSKVVHLIVDSGPLR